jgi:hypothetical protein
MQAEEIKPNLYILYNVAAYKYAGDFTKTLQKQKRLSKERVLDEPCSFDEVIEAFKSFEKSASKDMFSIEKPCNIKSHYSQIKQPVLNTLLTGLDMIVQKTQISIIGVDQLLGHTNQVQGSKPHLRLVKNDQVK